MNLFFVRIISVFAFLFVLAFQSQAKDLPDPRLYINKVIVKERYVEIQYEINFGGFVILQLFNSDRETIWSKGKVEDGKGKYVFRIARKPLSQGDFYRFTLKYKGRDYNGTFTNDDDGGN